MKMKRNCVVLLSGGIDSATVLAIAKNKGYDTYALTFDYKQRHRIEIERAKDIVASSNVKKHLILSADLDRIGGSALTSNIQVPCGRGEVEISKGIPVTYVPGRNILFLSYALSWAEVIEAYDIFIGVNAIDYSGYPDCRPEFIELFENMANAGTKSGAEGKKIHIRTPLIRMTKSDIIRKGAELDVDFRLTWSCYDPAPDQKPCGNCDSCFLRMKGCKEAGLTDPLLYNKEP